ncbi:MAG: DUF4105 domain-containing protein [Phycisphaerales bacterium]|nr:MAG: DUF4105 domain-containing protein [Phycisphaerales bacterium]
MLVARMVDRADSNLCDTKRGSRWRSQLVRVGLALLVLAITLWGAAAIYWSNLPVTLIRILIAIAFTALGLWTIRMLVVRPRERDRRAWLAFPFAFAVVWGWWLFIPPSHDRDWVKPQSRLPTIEVAGDQLIISEYRDFRYDSNEDFYAIFRTRELELSAIESADLYLSRWEGSGRTAHTFVGFNVRDEEPVIISIESRLERGESFGLVRSCFKQHELIYVVGSPRDVIGVRVKHRGEQVTRFRLQAAPDQVRSLFLAYAQEVNDLAAQPRWYHLLRNNCTTNIVRKAFPDRRWAQWDYRLLFNGLADRYAYDHGLIDESVPFSQLRREAVVTKHDALLDHSRRQR